MTFSISASTISLALVSAAFDAATTRYTVQMEGDDGSAISVRPANLELA